ncbi:MAG: YitT family protein [Erysipelotrichaceae bacterium]|nr:YitT family protein [Erysipelotrichaceae bacterium]
MNNTDRLKSLYEYLWISLGTLLVAMAVSFYLIPCKIITGSVSGLSVVITEIIPLSDSLIVLIMNIVCLYIGIRCLGKKFGIRSVYISLLLPLLIEVLSSLNISLASENELINITLFLLILTAGQCILFGMDTASGGLDTIAEVLAIRYHTSIGLMVALIGALCCIITIAVYGLSTALIGVIVTIVNGIMINLFTAAYRFHPLKTVLSKAVVIK